jgi:hypothetical protein
MDENFNDYTKKKPFKTLRYPSLHDHINMNKTRGAITVLRETNHIPSARERQRLAHEVQTTFRHDESTFSLAVIAPACRYNAHARTRTHTHNRQLRSCHSETFKIAKRLVSSDCRMLCLIDAVGWVKRMPSGRWHHRTHRLLAVQDKLEDQSAFVIRLGAHGCATIMEME